MRATIVLCFAGLTLAAFAQEAPMLPPQDGLGVMRGLNTAESGLSSATGVYAALSAVLPKLGAIGSEAIPLDEQTATLRDYRLSLVRSQDAKHYNASLLPSHGCQTAWFTDERGVIYKGLPLGCPETK